MVHIRTISNFAKGEIVKWINPENDDLYGHTFEITNVSQSSGDVYLVGVDTNKSGWLWNNNLNKIERVCSEFQEENDELDGLFDCLDRTEESV